MADYGAYHEGQPSVASSLFGTPGKAWWTMQKSSVLLNAASSGMWNAAAAGKGVRWGGVVGVRNLALGRGAYGMGPGIIHEAAIGIYKTFQKDAAKVANFTKYGLFGQSEGTMGGIGKFLGGGVIEGTKFGQDKLYYSLLGKGGLSPKAAKQYLIDNKGLEATFKKALTGDKAAIQAVKNHRKVISPKITPYAWQLKEASISAKVVTSMEKQIVKASKIRTLATIGKAGSFLMAASIAYDIGSFVGTSTINMIGNVSDRLEGQLQKISNRQMEFGGKVGIGFYSGRSGTERQRALSAITSSSSPGFGNEGAYQHVDNTW